MATVKLGYESSIDAQFKGEIETDVERERWKRMSQDEQQAVIDEHVYDLLTIYVIDDDEGES